MDDRRCREAYIIPTGRLCRCMYLALHWQLRVKSSAVHTKCPIATGPAAPLRCSVLLPVARMLSSHGTPPSQAARLTNAGRSQSVSALRHRRLNRDAVLPRCLTLRPSCVLAAASMPKLSLSLRLRRTLPPCPIKSSPPLWSSLTLDYLSPPRHGPRLHQHLL